MIYWTENEKPQQKKFGSAEMSLALKFTESLRKIQREEGTVGFIGMVSENPDCTSKLGVDVTGPDYDWKKRRI